MYFFHGSISFTFLYRNYYLQSFIRKSRIQKKKLSHNKLCKKKKVAIGNQITVKKLYMIFPLADG